MSRVLVIHTDAAKEEMKTDQNTSERLSIVNIVSAILFGAIVVGVGTYALLGMGVPFVLTGFWAITGGALSGVCCYLVRKICFTDVAKKKMKTDQNTSEHLSIVTIESAILFGAIVVGVGTYVLLGFDDRLAITGYWGMVGGALSGVCYYLVREIYLIVHDS